MKLPGVPAGRLEKTSSDTVNGPRGSVTTKEYVNHKTGQTFRYIVTRATNGNLISADWFSDINPRTRASVIPQQDRGERSTPEKKVVKKADKFSKQKAKR